MKNVKNIVIKCLHHIAKHHLIFAALKGYPWYRMFLSAITQGMTLETEKYLPYLKFFRRAEESDYPHCVALDGKSGASSV